MQTIVTTLLTADLDHTDAASPRSTASIAPGANTQIRVYWSSSAATTGPDVVVTGLGLTWTPQVSSVDGGRAMGLSTAMTGGSPPTPGVLTLTSAATDTGIAWCVLGDVGVDLAAPLRQAGVLGGGPADTSTSTTATVTLSATDNAANRPGLWVAHRGNTATTPRANWTELWNLGSSGPNMDYEYQQRTDAFEATCTATWTTAVRWQAIAVELRAAADVGGDPSYWGVLA